MSIKNKIIEGNALSVLKSIETESIDCCITSPPYWGLRDYGHEDQLGSEKHFKDFIINLCDVFDQVKRILKPTGTCFINIGDTFNGYKLGNTSNKGYLENTTVNSFKKEKTELPNKSLCMIPERFAIEMIDRGWCLRNQIIWHKPNQMPSSANDRFTVDFEKVFFFVKQPNDYYFEQQLEPALTNKNRPNGVVRNREYNYDSKENKNPDAYKKTHKNIQNKGQQPNSIHLKRASGIPDETYVDRNVRTVWSINTKPFKEAHFATYPELLVERMLKSGCPENGIVLDPFFGSGTTGVYARKVNRNFLGVELNPEYIKIAEKRLLNELGFFL